MPFDNLGGTTSRDPENNQLRERTGSGFVNINKFLQANQNNQLANKVNTGVSNDVNQYNQLLSNTANEFNNQINPEFDRLNNINTDIGNVFGEVKNSPDKLLYGQNPILRQQDQSGNSLRYGGPGSITPPGVTTTKSGSASPLTSKSTVNVGDYSDFDPNNQNNAYNRFDQYRNDKYNGPQTLNDSAYRELNARASGLDQLRNTLSDPSKRGNLLSQYINNPNYNPQMRSLDSVLFGFSPASNNIGGTQIGNAGGKLKNLKTTSEGSANLAARSFGNLGNSINTQADVIGNPINTNWTNQTDSTNQDRARSVQDLKNAAAVGNYSGDQLAGLGLTPGMQTFGLKSSILDPQYFSTNPDVTKGNIISDYDRARLRGLDMLKGNTAQMMSTDDARRSGELAMTPQDRSDRYQTGYGGSVGKGYDFNSGAFLDAVKARQDQYNTDLNKNNAATGVNLTDIFSTLSPDQRAQGQQTLAGLGINVDPNQAGVYAENMYQYEEPVTGLLGSLLDQGGKYGATGQQQLLDNFEKTFKQQVVDPWGAPTAGIGGAEGASRAPTAYDTSSDTKRNNINQMIARYQSDIAKARQAINDRLSSYNKSMGADERL